ncbi:hypothetical protein [Streptomyces sp. NPDC002889]
MYVRVAGAVRFGLAEHLAGDGGDLALAEENRSKLATAIPRLPVTGLGSR